MKKTIKVMAAIMLVAAMVFSIASCGGLDMNKIKGDWTLSTIGGKSVADYAASAGASEYQFAGNYNFTDKNVTITTLPTDSITSATMDIKVKSNGIEVMSGDQVAFSMIYDDKAETLTFSVDPGTGTAISYVLKKGTTDLQALYNAANAPAEDDGGAGDEGEYYDDEGEYYDDEGEYEE